MVSDQVQPLFQKAGHQRTVVYRILLLHQFMCLLIYQRKLLLDRHSRNIFLLITGMYHIL